jgi:hypothetical protein
MQCSVAQQDRLKEGWMQPLEENGERNEPDKTQKKQAS